MTKALLIIDVQKAVVAKGAPPDRQALIDAALDAVVARLVRLKAQARAAGVPVILIQNDSPPGERLAAGTPGWALRDELAPAPGDTVIHKESCDSFHDTSLGAYLADHGIRHLVVGGCMSEYCVDTTVRRAVSLGYDVTLISDGHTTADSGSLGFDAISAHHNTTLNGFAAGVHRVSLQPAAAIQF